MVGFEHATLLITLTTKSPALHANSFNHKASEHTCTFTFMTLQII